MPGCPPSADRIHHVLDELLAGRLPGPEHARFGV
jgi:coenzyme F420-reducing hydrogenase gamma subunit